MNLETAQSFSASNATPDDIRRVVMNDTERGEYVILSKSKTCFIQAAGDTEPFHVEYYDDDHKRAVQCKSDISATELKRILVQYLQMNPKWRGDHEWQEEPESPWWKFWKLLQRQSTGLLAEFTKTNNHGITKR